MNRPMLSRVLTAFWAIWLGFAMSEPGALHSCPTHGDHAAHGAHAAHMASMAQHHTSSAPANHGDHSGCTCLGTGCCSASVSGPVVSVLELPVIAVISVPAAPIAHERVTVKSVTAYAHPFANGPPPARSL